MKQYDKGYKFLRKLYLIGAVLATIILMMVIHKVWWIAILMGVSQFFLLASLSKRINQITLVDSEAEKKILEDRAQKWKLKAESEVSEMILWRDKTHELEKNNSELKKSLENNRQVSDLNFIGSQDKSVITSE